MPLPLLAAAPALLTAAKAGAATGFLAKAGAAVGTAGKISGAVGTIAQSVSSIFNRDAERIKRNIAQTESNLRQAERAAKTVEDRFVNQTRVRAQGVDPRTGTEVSIVLEPPSVGEVRAAKGRVESLKVRKAMFENAQGPARGSQLVTAISAVGGLLQNSGVAKGLGNVATKIFPTTPGIIKKAGAAVDKVKELAVKAIPDSGVAKNIDNIAGAITGLVRDQRSPQDIPSRTTPVRDTRGVITGQQTVSPIGGGRGGIIRGDITQVRGDMVRTPPIIPPSQPDRQQGGNMGLIIAFIAAILFLR